MNAERYTPQGINEEGHCLFCGRKLGWYRLAQQMKDTDKILANPEAYSEHRVEYAKKDKENAAAYRAKNARGYDGEGMFCSNKCSELFGGFMARSQYRIMRFGMAGEPATYRVAVAADHARTVPTIAALKAAQRLY